MIKIQYIPTDDAGIIYTNLTTTSTINWTVRLFIKRIVKYNAPYIDIELNSLNNQNQAFPGIVNESGSILSVVKNNEHEQYITSQFLEGSGVGALLPDNYDPKLREQLPDIINKTGIDINSLT